MAEKKGKGKKTKFKGTGFDLAKNMGKQND